MTPSVSLRHLFASLLAAALLLAAGPATAQAPDAFTLDLTVSDAAGNSFLLEVGMDPAAEDPGASNTSDPFDNPAPPAPPSSSIFDARIAGPGTGFQKDIRATSEQLTFQVVYRGESSGGVESDVTLTWGDAGLPDGALRLTDDPTGASETFGIDLDAAGSSPAPDTQRDFSGYRYLYVVVDLAPPAAPTGLGATPLSPTEIDLGWTDNATDEDTYEVERSESGAAGPFALLSTEAADATSFSDTGLAPETEYCYRVRATSNVGPSDYTDVACATTPAEPTGPDAPSDVQAAATSPSEVALSWTDNAGGTAAFEVQVSPDESAWTDLVTTAAGATSYTDTGLAPASTHCYRVRASEGGLASAWVASQPACVTTPEATLAFDPSSLAFALPVGSGTDSDEATLSVTEGPDPAGPVALTATDDDTGLTPTWLTAPASVSVGVPATFEVDVAGLAPGTYAATVTADAPGYSAAALAVTLNVSDVAGLDFGVTITATEQAGVPLPLFFGTAADATDDFDVAYDRFAPPPPPSPAFDARFSPPVQDLQLYDDVRASLTDTNPSVAWLASVRASLANYPVTLDWTGATLPAEGSLYLYDGSSASPVDMREVSTYELDAACVTADPCTTTFEIVHSQTVDFPLAVGSGWQLLGLPNAPEDNAYDAIFADPPLSQPPFVWSNGAYAVANDLFMGEGFWAFFGEAATYTITGVEQQRLDYTLSQAGWHLLAGPSCAFPVAEIEDPDGIIIPGTIYVYENIYFTPTAIEEGKGAWLRVSGPGALAMDCAASAASGSRTVAQADASAEPAAALRLSVSDGVHSLALMLGLDPAATADFDAGFDRLAPPPAPAGGMDARLRGTNGGVPTDYYADVRRLEPGGEAVFPLSYTASASGGPIVLTWDASALGALGRFTLASSPDIGRAYTVDMSAMEQLDTSEHAAFADGLYIIWSDASSVAAEGDVQPGRFELRGSYPNPATGLARIVFDLAEASEVEVELFDMLGRSVFVAEARELPAGAGRAVDIDTASLPAGAYVYRATARSVTSSNVATGRLTVID